MNAANGKMSESTTVGGLFQRLWRQKSWWLLPLVVLLLLIGAFYVLGHLSAADPETYPTTLINVTSSLHLC
jgi:hypothetical protein